MKKLDFSNAIVLLYHGVTTERGRGVINCSGKHIHIDDFYRQIRYIEKNCNVVSLRELLVMLERGTNLVERTVVVTFDDSFRNVYKNAYPILKEYHIPAVLFIATGFVDVNRLIWADKLELILEQIRDEGFFLQCLKDLRYQGSFSMRNIVERQRTLEDIKKYLKLCDEKTKNNFIECLTDQYRCLLQNTESEYYETLTWDDIRTMSKDTLIEIGTHTVNHPILSKISLKEAEKEIVSSKKKLQDELGCVIDLFSYPEGQKGHYNVDIINILKKNGFICGLSAQYGDNPPGFDPFHIRRIMVGFSGISFPFSEQP